MRHGCELTSLSLTAQRVDHGGVLARINGHNNQNLHQFLPWNWKPTAAALAAYSASGANLRGPHRMLTKRRRPAQFASVVVFPRAIWTARHQMSA